MKVSLTEFQQRAAGAALDKLFTCTHFYICDLRKIANLIGQTERLCGPDYEALDVLNHAEYSKMGHALSMQVREKCLELLGLPPQVVEQEEPKPSPAASRAAPQRFLRLAFWR
jgi:hypothetical protein